MKPRIDGLYSIDLPEGPPQLPVDPMDCWVVIQVDIGTDRSAGTDTFTLYVTTPSRVEKLISSCGPVFGANMLLVSKFDWATVEDAIRNKVSAIEGSDWRQISVELAKSFQWEFEAYENSSD